MTLTDKQVQRIRQLHLKGEATTSIAERMGISSSAAARCVNNESYHDENYKPLRKVRLEIELASLLRSRGKSYADVASEVAAIQGKKWSPSWIRAAILSKQEQGDE
ncbi:MAG: hypothetical protein K8T91_26710 [Planctomycetes bacterium]|nr:hypothetical protein [Planctomycetota bacterium]